MEGKITPTNLLNHSTWLTRLAWTPIDEPQNDNPAQGRFKLSHMQLIIQAGFVVLGLLKNGSYGRLKTGKKQNEAVPLLDKKLLKLRWKAEELTIISAVEHARLCK